MSDLFGVGECLPGVKHGPWSPSAQDPASNYGKIKLMRATTAERGLFAGVASGRLCPLEEGTSKGVRLTAQDGRTPTKLIR